MGFDGVNDEFWRFVETNASADVSALRLKYHGRGDIGFDVELAILQIECRRKYAKKLSATLAAAPHFLFPDKLVAEQSTSDVLARWHAGIVADCDKVIDLTAGLGIDLFHIAKTARMATAVELDPARAEALRHNAAELALENVEVVCADCRDVVASAAAGSFDAAFIDPARRGSGGERVFALADCAPDVTSLQSGILKMALRLVVKMSPMLDLTNTMRELPLAEEIQVIGTPTECKELVAVVRDSEPASKKLVAVTLSGLHARVVETTVSDWSAGKVVYGMPVAGDLLAEPLPAVMKLGMYADLCARFGLKKIAPNTQLYFYPEGVSADENCQSAVRFERIVEVVPYKSGEIKRFRNRYPRASVGCRNFPISAEALRGKLRVKEGDAHRVVGVTDSDGAPWLIIAQTYAQ